MTRKLARLLLSSALLLALCLACSGLTGPRAQVNCQGVGDAYACTIEHTGGGSGPICWDIQATCNNGTVTSARSCVEIAPSQTVSHNVPISSFPNFAACDGVATLQIIDRTGT